ncbi:hypothetical protein AAG906_019144 [Vitis piasezkii]
MRDGIFEFDLVVLRQAPRKRLGCNKLHIPEKQRIALPGISDKVQTRIIGGTETWENRSPPVLTLALHPPSPVTGYRLLSPPPPPPPPPPPKENYY